MDLHYLKLFHVLALQGSFTKAAESLHISQPALSVQIKKLEGQLGMKLFDKVGNKIALNENGKLLSGYTQQIFALVDEAEHILLNKTECIIGSVNVGGSNTPGAYILPKIIGEFKSLYPKVEVNLHIANTDETAHMVINGQVDFAVNGGNLPYNHSICIEKLMDDKAVLAASPLNRLSEKEFVKPSDFADINFVSHETNSYLHKFLENFIQEMKIPSRIAMKFGGIDAIKQAISADLGISLLPYSAVSFELKSGLIKELRIRGKSWSYPYSLIYHKNKYLSPAVKKLMEMVRTRMYDLRIPPK
ncbi:LysR family transcriptional regulator [Candidatus Formimonas warabiya]|uniref:HTH lysR-type domain-containing protein n=1 Tax=Formimonas warabiya TaxID=1761012 RepID=A0A3G1KXS5_FORW1|nr:LysR family transcriptional regulator [Candidatus Formimonas warabiya]ATW27242.1 hypothetical protein DCMF_23015 [Candidatus Formimonas warabiya]